MSRVGLAVAVGVLLLAVSTFAAAPKVPLRDSVDSAIAGVKPALVRIQVVSTTYRRGREQKYIASGSGIIITPEGHVITNHHVAGDAAQLVCTLTNREEVKAELVGSDALTDIAVIRLLPEKPRQFPIAEFGDSDGVKVGDHVMSMGSPMGISQSVTLGIVSNTEMVMPRGMGLGAFELDGEDVGTLVKWIAHDAVIYGGNSGGALVDIDGRIVGINEISMGLGGAIPGNLAQRVAQALIQDGYVKRSWLGITARPLLKHGGHKRGVLITGTFTDSPAGKAGFESGDLLLSVGGRETNVRFDEEMPAFNRIVADLPLGEEVEATVLRGGETITITIVPAQRERRRPRQWELKPWGITARNLSFLMAKEMRRPDVRGAVVTSLRPGGPAGEAKPSIARRDIVIDVAGNPVDSVEDLVAVTRELTKNATGPVPALTTFVRGAGTYVTLVKLGSRDLHDPGLEVKKAWLPVRTQVITRDIAAQVGKADMKGFRVTQVLADSTVEAAALQVGDYIVAVDGERLTASSPEDYEELPALVRSYTVGTTVELTVERDGERIAVPFELMRSPKVAREMQKYTDDNFEFTARDVTFFDRADARWKQEEAGVLVDEVISGSWADLASLQVGDLIRKIDGTVIANVDALRRTMEEVSARQAAAAVFEVLRGIYTVYVELEPNWARS